MQAKDPKKISVVTNKSWCLQIRVGGGENSACFHRPLLSHCGSRFGRGGRGRGLVSWRKAKRGNGSTSGRVQVWSSQERADEKSSGGCSRVRGEGEARAEQNRTEQGSGQGQPNGGRHTPSAHPSSHTPSHASRSWSLQRNHSPTATGRRINGAVCSMRGKLAMAARAEQGRARGRRWHEWMARLMQARRLAVAQVATRVVADCQRGTRALCSRTSPRLRQNPARYRNPTPAIG